MKAGKIIARTTRRAFRKKLITFGLSAFMCLALTATGFAAWMLSKDAQKSAEGNIQVAAVSEAGIEMSDLAFSPSDVTSFKLEPLQNDESGQVRWDGTNYENLTVGLTWTITNFQNVGNGTFIEFAIPATIQAIVDKNYIALPTEFVEDEEKSGEAYTVYAYELPAVSLATGDGGATLPSGDLTINSNIISGTYTKTGESVTASFNLTLQLKWGTAFNSKNPSEYFDDGNHNDYATIKNTLNDLKAASHGLDKTTLLNLIKSEINEAKSNELKDIATAAEILGELTEAEQDKIFAKAPIATYKVTVYAKA